MRNGLVLTALAGLASGAMAQSLSVHVHFGSNEISVGETTSAVMTATFTGPGTPYMSVADFNLIGHGDAQISNLVFGAWHMNSVGPISGEVSDDDIVGVKLSQHAFFGAVDTTSTSLVIASWTVTCTGQSIWYHGSETGSPFSFGISDSDNAFGQPITYSASIITSDFLLVPTPAGLGIFTIGGVFASRRRR